MASVACCSRSCTVAAAVTTGRTSRCSLPSRSAVLRRSWCQRELQEASYGKKYTRRGFGGMCAVAEAAEATELDVSKMEPLGDRLLVRPEEEASTTEGGILLTAGANKNLHEAVIGTVVALGGDVDVSVKAGDTILFSKYSTTDIEVPDGKVAFVAQKSVLAVLS